MSLYSHEEICKGCIHAVFHECCKKFCHCEDIDLSDHYKGKCANKKESKKWVVR